MTPTTKLFLWLFYVATLFNDETPMHYSILALYSIQTHYQIQKPSHIQKSYESNRNDTGIVTLNDFLARLPFTDNCAMAFFTMRIASSSSGV